MSAKSILDAILQPAPLAQFGYRAAAVTSKNGERVEGLVRNEDNFSLQLLTQDGNFHFFQKSEVQSLEYLNRSFMPANYGDRLTQSELNDLASFMMSQHSAPGSARTSEE